jgi:hypothetical protein
MVNYVVAVWTSGKRRRSRIRRENIIKKRSELHIKKELDELLVHYNNGELSEQQYLDEANPLIDKLADLNLNSDQTLM